MVLCTRVHCYLITKTESYYLYWEGGQFLEVWGSRGTELCMCDFT